VYESAVLGSDPVTASDWITLAVGVLAVVGTLGGVVFGAQLAHRSATDGLRAQLAEERRREVTALLAEIAVDGHAVIEAGWVEIPAFAGMELHDLSEYADTDSGKRNGERRNRLNETLAQRTAVLAQHIRDWPEKAVGPVLEKTVRGRRDTDAILKGFDHLNAIRRALNEFELAAREMLTRDVGADRARATLPPVTNQLPAREQETSPET